MLSLLFLIFTNQISQCQISQLFGRGAIFVDLNNKTIDSFSFESNFTFKIQLAKPSPISNLDQLFSLACVDLTSAVCNDYIGFCPKTVFIISMDKINTINYNASSTHNFNHLLLQF